jgi:hypothetical protein
LAQVADKLWRFVRALFARSMGVPLNDIIQERRHER